MREQIPQADRPLCADSGHDHADDDLRWSTT